VALTLLLLTGCSSLADIAGLATGAVAGGASANPAVGYAVAVGTAAAADATFKWISRHRQGAEQDAIADVAGNLKEGQTASWRIRHTIPIGNERGEVRVVRELVTPLATCKEIAFSVADDPPEPDAHYVTTLCRDADQWKWALAEPAVDRWGYLQ
jgi:hypothetical protein